ncbi:acyl carrier protein [Fervidicella metallireducens AeB]|uniref:Acyl carrier protein n=1 Tax=Fervidicella metallireducens AeB TaxID=1403537 RepID=A0A017RZT6_9CLOT|nr:acyl carrier protein [Fervidicella metallireducens]EYE89445.1 acyl carrier protein [Fervidicella metallireducens AeB]
MEEYKKIFAKVLNLDENKVNNDISMENTQTWDSFANILLIIELERALEIKFTIDEIERIKDFESLEKIIKGKIKE